MPRPVLPVALATGLALSGLAGVAPPAAAASPDLVISQVYGGGGNSGAVFTNDFVELFNRGSAPVSVDGWTVQYASAAGSSWSVTRLSGTVAPGRWYLLGLAAGAGAGAPLPTPDATGTANLSGTAGKVALVPSTTPLTCGAAAARCAPESYRDLVGYGAASDYEGTAAAPALTNSTAALRAGGGGTDTDSNSADVTAGTPAPRNSGSTGGPAEPPPPAGDPCAETAPVRIPAVQGTTDTSPYTGRTVTTRGVVVGDTAGLNGFFVQDPAGDGDPATSDGLFVFLPAANPLSSLDVAVGDEVALTGTVKEFLGQTQVDTLTALARCGVLPAPAPTVYALPEPVEGDLERLEGMAVTVPTTLTVQQNFFLGRFGQLTLASGGRRQTPTNVAVPGSAEARALADANARSFLVLDDANARQNPAPLPYLDAQGTRRAGDTVSGLTGVLDFGPVNSSTAVRDYRLQPTQAPVFASDGRPAAPAPVGGTLRAASFNVLNYFTDLATTSSSPFRGANTPEEFQRQKAKIVAALVGLDADVVGLIEMQNNDVAPQDLVQGLNDAVGAPGRWAVVPDPANGVGDDAIKVAQIYRTDRVTLVGDSRSPLDQSAFDGQGRPPVAQAYRQTATGEVSTLVINHFKSKGSCPSGTGPDSDRGDGQGCWNAVRVAQAGALAAFVDELTAVDPDVLVVGDLNAYGEEDPVRLLESRGLVDLLQRELGPEAYSYVFDGASGRLDHALATPALAAQVTGATEWHVNADEPSVIDYNLEFKPDDRYAPTPYRSSDHDPVLVGLALTPPPAVSVGDASATEGGALRFPVTLSRPATTETSVQVDTVPGTAGAGDVPAVSTRVVLPAGATRAEVVVPTTADSVDEVDEQLTVVLSAPTGLVLGDATATGTVVDDDTAAVSVTGGAVLEGARGTRTPLPFTVRLSTTSSRDTVVDVRTADGTAVASCDYVAVARTVVVPAGSTSVVVPVTVLGDKLKEADETVRLVATSSGAVATATGTIRTDDGAGRDKQTC